MRDLLMLCRRFRFVCKNPKRESSVKYVTHLLISIATCYRYLQEIHVEGKKYLFLIIIIIQLILVLKQEKAESILCIYLFQVTIDRHPVRFFVHKRPHVDFFLEVVRES